MCTTETMRRTITGLIGKELAAHQALPLTSEYERNILAGRIGMLITAELENQIHEAAVSLAAALICQLMESQS